MKQQRYLIAAAAMAAEIIGQDHPVMNEVRTEAMDSFKYPEPNYSWPMPPASRGMPLHHRAQRGWRKAIFIRSHREIQRRQRRNA